PTKISVASLHGHARCFPESCPENGNVPKSPLLTIGSLVPSVGTKSRSQNNPGFPEAARHFSGSPMERLHEAARVHHAFRRSGGCVAARRQRAADQEGLPPRGSVGRARCISGCPRSFPPRTS